MLAAFFGLALLASSRSTYSTSCLILALALLDFFGEECLQRMRASGVASIVLFSALGIGISFTNLDTRAIFIV